MTPEELGRRSFLVALSGAFGGLAIGVVTRDVFADDASRGPSVAPEALEDRRKGLAPNVLVHVAEDGIVTITCPRSEMGQGIRSSQPVLIADELGASLSRVVVRQADGDKKYGDQNTDGSTSIRRFEETSRHAGAAARMMLISAAAAKWKVKPETCEAKDHAVVHVATKRSLGFGELAAAAGKLPVPKPDTIVLRPRSSLVNIARPSLPLLDGASIVRGTARFGADVKLDGMLIAVVARPPVVGGKPSRFDATRALAIPGVRKVVEMPTPKPPYGFQPWGGIAVIADNTWSAMRGRAALDITWDDGPNATYDSVAFKETMLQAVRAPGKTMRSLGDVEAAFKTANSVVEAEYVVPHLAHLPMEPPVAVADFKDGKCEVWAPTQHPQAAMQECARVLGIADDKVTVHVTLLGGGFGRKSKADFASEAAFLSRAAGAPVRVQWTREDDVRHDYYNTTNAQRLRAALDGTGKVVAWHQRTAFPPIATTFGAQGIPSIRDLQQGVLDLALDVPNVQSEACPADAHVRIGWYRSVYNIFHAFSAGSFIDEIAHAKKADPRDVWLEIIGPARTLGLKDLGVTELANYGESLERHPVDAGRLRNVIERVTKSARWDERKQSGRALGLAAHRSFVSYTAVVLHVVEDPIHKVRVEEAWISMDPGAIVNRDRVASQMEGAVVMGISNALFGGITMRNGVAEQSNFRDAKIARIAQVPRKIHVDIVPSVSPPGGVGEPGVPPVGAALANAVFALTGKRIREIPLIRSV
ncbi:MAG: xanthine dehydrogenase family protein molybdopterin-binding subunit [Polyangiaceae bacterium]|nr:xanthine dehydrogenase family protein molybdopterin-binding subunit [Polyangiaceae bacterium]